MMKLTIEKRIERTLADLPSLFPESRWPPVLFDDHERHDLLPWRDVRCARGAAGRS